MLTSLIQFILPIVIVLVSMPYLNLFSSKYKSILFSIVLLISQIYIIYGSYLAPYLSAPINEVCGRGGCHKASLVAIFGAVILIPLLALFGYWDSGIIKNNNNTSTDYFQFDSEKPKQKIKFGSIIYVSIWILVYIGLMSLYTYMIFWG